MIDPATGWFEIQQYDDKQSITVANIIEQEWFSRYPWPTQVTFDRGSEFIGQDFQQMIKKTMASQQNPLQSIPVTTLKNKCSQDIHGQHKSYLRSREQIHQSEFSTNYQNVYGIKLKPITVKNPQAKMLL